MSPINDRLIKAEALKLDLRKVFKDSRYKLEPIPGKNAEGVYSEYWIYGEGEPEKRTILRISYGERNAPDRAISGIELDCKLDEIEEFGEFGYSLDRFYKRSRAVYPWLEVKQPFSEELFVARRQAKIFAIQSRVNPALVKNMEAREQERRETARRAELAAQFPKRKLELEQRTEPDYSAL